MCHFWLFPRRMLITIYCSSLHTPMRIFYCRARRSTTTHLARAPRSPRPRLRCWAHPLARIHHPPARFHPPISTCSHSPLVAGRSRWYCSFSSQSSTPLWCLWSPNLPLAPHSLFCCLPRFSLLRWETHSSTWRWIFSILSDKAYLKTAKVTFTSHTHIWGIAVTLVGKRRSLPASDHVNSFSPHTMMNTCSVVSTGYGLFKYKVAWNRRLLCFDLWKINGSESHWKPQL